LTFVFRSKNVFGSGVNSSGRGSAQFQQSMTKTSVKRQVESRHSGVVVDAGTKRNCNNAFYNGAIRHSIIIMKQNILQWCNKTFH